MDKILPIFFKGIGEEPDEEFFNVIAKPVKQTAELFSNMEYFLEVERRAKLSSQKYK